MGGTAVIIPADVAALLVRPASIDVSDLTSAPRAGAPAWTEGGALSIPFDPEPTESEQGQIRRRLLTKTPEEEAWVGALLDAYADLAEDPTPVATATRLLIQDRLGPLFTGT